MKFIILLVFALISSLSSSQPVSIQNGWMVIDGERFFVKGIGYETHTRPGQVPWEYSFNASLIESDLNRIKAAGFNTIRTWGAITEEELALIQASGLKIIFGIWIDPSGEFSSQTFRTSALESVEEVMDYAPDYDCIIGYLIMNEPQVAHIYSEGALALASLWNEVITTIHQSHPGVPVSFSNTMVGDYIDMDRFDFSGYNAYIYGPATLSHAPGYAPFLEFLKANRSVEKPMIITEYGLSVSPAPYTEEYTYGGNTLDQQVTGNLEMFRQLLDAGLQGNCAFQYHDGWWKADNPSTHDSNPEEWFGFIGFTDLTDQMGYERPVWQAYTTYNQAIILQPRNETVYTDTIPLEFYLEPTIARYELSRNDTIFQSGEVTQPWFTGQWDVSSIDHLTDMNLDFSFFNHQGDTVKTETLSILVNPQNVALPSLSLSLLPDELVAGRPNYLIMNVNHHPDFTIEANTVTIVFHPHLGFAPGEVRQKPIFLSNNQWQGSDFFTVSTETRMVTYGAGFTIRYGSFTKRITDVIIRQVGNWADAIAAPGVHTSVSSSPEKPTGLALSVYPNPFNPATIIHIQSSPMAEISLQIVDLVGRVVWTSDLFADSSGTGSVRWNGRDQSGKPVASGVYVVTARSESRLVTETALLIK